MFDNTKFGPTVLAIGLFAGLSVLGYLLADAAIRFKAFERSVTVKGLSEREYPADIVIWPIQFSTASNDLEALYRQIDLGIEKTTAFLEGSGIRGEEISYSSPTIIDKSARPYGERSDAEFRYAATQIVTVYSQDIETARNLMRKTSELGKQGLALTGDDYQSQVEYVFTRLNDVKPEMIEESTTKAREVAEKFAADSRSTLGKIKRASQGQFSISARDKNNPHIKQVRVVSTVTYYLSD